MNRLSSQQRNLVYLAIILVLLIPVIWLGMPAAKADGSGGGRLAQLRVEYDLGESSLGNVDPSSATMNLVLLGFRGFAVSHLSLQNEEYKKTKNWAQMRATTESITMLQPHFLEVWRNHGWNLAYNVSAEWDGVADRYYWVKEGGKFLMKGTARNRRYAELPHDVGQNWGKKIGRSDEWRQFRYYFREQDPDPEINGPDPDINPEGFHNYLVAKRWFEDANEVQRIREQHIMAPVLFRHYPARSLMDWADALQTGDQGHEPIFGEVTRRAWADAKQEWTQVYGQERFQAPDCEIILEATEDDIRALAQASNVSEDVVRHWIFRYQDMTNYRYWRTRADAESEPNTVDAHRYLYEGQQLFLQGDETEAERVLFEGLQKYEQMLLRFQDMGIDDNAIEEAVTGLIVWRKARELTGEPVPSVYPLMHLWNSQEPDRIAELERRWNRQYNR
jgi:hypothetical protein